MTMRATLLALLLALPASLLAAQDNAFSIAERRLIIDHYAEKAPAVPTTEAGGRRVEVGDKLPPGVEVKPLPQELEARLPPRGGARRGVVDKDVVLVDPAQSKVLDVLIDAARE